MLRVLGLLVRTAIVFEPNFCFCGVFWGGLLVLSTVATVVRMARAVVLLLKQSVIVSRGT